MKKFKRINRGGLMFAVIAIVVTILIIVEASAVAAVKRDIFEVIQNNVEIQSKYVILPEEMRSGDISDEKIDEYINRCADELKSIYAYSDKVSSVENAKFNIVLYGMLRDCIINQIRNGKYYDKIEYKYIRYARNKGQNIILNGNDAIVIIELYADLSYPYGGNENYECRLTKINGEWKILSVKNRYE